MPGLLRSAPTALLPLGFEMNVERTCPHSRQRQWLPALRLVVVTLSRARRNEPMMRIGDHRTARRAARQHLHLYLQ